MPGRQQRGVVNQEAQQELKKKSAKYQIRLRLDCIADLIVFLLINQKNQHKQIGIDFKLR